LEEFRLQMKGLDQKIEQLALRIDPSKVEING
jgi:hypothetical protein